MKNDKWRDRLNAPTNVEYIENSLRSMRRDKWWVEAFGKAQVREWIWEYKGYLKAIRKAERKV